MKIRYRKTKWWNLVHYNYFHKKLFKDYYNKKKNFTNKEIKKYKLFQKIDDLITLRNWTWLRVFIWKLEK